MSAVHALVRRLLGAAALAGMLALLAPGAALADTCAPAATRGTAPADFRDYCWLDFSGYSDSTARSTAGQNFTFTLPDGTAMRMNVKVTAGTGVGGGTAVRVVPVPSWSGSAFGNVAFNGIPGRPILYNATNDSIATVTLSNIEVVPPSGGMADYSIVVGDGESSNANESLRFETTGEAWQQIAQIQNGTSTLYPTLAYSDSSKTVTITGRSGTVGSYVFRSGNNPRTITARMQGEDLQGVIIGMRYASISVVSQLAGTRYQPADQFTYGLKTAGGTTLVSASSTGSASNGFPVAAMPTVAASYPFVVSQAMAAGSVGTLANYRTSLTCVNAASGSQTQLPANEPVSSYTFPSLRYGDSVFCTFTNTPVFSSVSGSVYADANHNNARDGGEAGIGSGGLFVKLAPVSGGACAGPALQAVAVNATTGAYTVPNVPQGDYCVVLDTDSTLTDVTPGRPAGWVGTQNAGGSATVAVPAGSSPAPPQHFGLFNGSRLDGKVFADTGTGGAMANDGTQQPGELGLAGITVHASAVAVADAVTAGDGSFTLWVPASVIASVTLTPAAPAGYLASGGAPGTTGGTYARPSVSYVPAAGQVRTGVAFGLVLPSQLAPNGAQTAPPGGVAFYPHTFRAGSGGRLALSLASAPSPSVEGWTMVLYRDSNCNAVLDAGEPVLDAPLAVVAGQQVCLVVKQFVPAGIALGARNVATLTASFSFTNANPALAATLVVTDVTTSGEPSALNLKKMVTNLTRGGAAATSVHASPGEVLQYTLTAQNNGAGPLTTLVIHDTTPAFTTFVSAACPAVLPAGIASCAVSEQPASGAPGSLQWTFGGALQSGAQLGVSYQVRLTD